MKKSLLLSDEVQAAYRERITDKEYRFNAQEVCLAGLVQGVGITIVVPHVDGAAVKHDEVIIVNSEQRILLHKNDRFMVCLPKQ